MTRECPSGKQSFRNKGDAQNGMERIQRENPTTSRLRNVYPCELCRSWHMTSQPRHGHRLGFHKKSRYISMEDIAAAAHEIRSGQLEDPSALRAPLTAQQRVGIVAAAALRSLQSSETPSPDHRAPGGAQIESSTR